MVWEDEIRRKQSHEAHAHSPCGSVDDEEAEKGRAGNVAVELMPKSPFRRDKIITFTM